MSANKVLEAFPKNTQKIQCSASFNQLHLILFNRQFLNASHIQGTGLSIWKERVGYSPQWEQRHACVWVLSVSYVDRENGQESNLIQIYVYLYPTIFKKGNLRLLFYVFLCFIIIAQENTTWLEVGCGTH